GHGIEAEAQRAGLVAGGVGDLPSADHALGRVAGLRSLGVRSGGAEPQRDHRESDASQHEKSKSGGVGADAITGRSRRHALLRRGKAALRNLHARDLPEVYARAFGGHGVSATGVSGGLPAAQASRLSTTN